MDNLSDRWRRKVPDFGSPDQAIIGQPAKPPQAGKALLNY